MYSLPDASAPPPAPWHHAFASTFAQVAATDAGYFQRLTFADVRQDRSRLQMFLAWVDEQVALGTPDIEPLWENLATIALIDQHATGQLDRDQLVAALVDAVRPPWSDRPVALAFAEVDQALVGEFAHLDDVYLLAGRLAQVFDRDSGFTFAQWSVAADDQAAQIVEMYLPYFVAACEEQLRGYLPPVNAYPSILG